MSTQNSALWNIPIKDRPNFFLIKKVPHEETGKNYRLTDLFRAVIEMIPITLGTNHMRGILLENLCIPEINLRQPLLNVLEETVLHYCKTWKGWEKSYEHYKKPFESQVGFIEITKFLTSKCQFVITHANEYIQELSKSQVEEAQVSDVPDQICPYKLAIGGAPSILNTLVAVIKDDDILLKQHEESPWTTVTMPQFLNWPYVSVEIKLLDIHLKRVNSHNIQQYIAKANQKISPPQTDFISEVVKYSDDGKPYTHTFFCFYFIQLFNVLQKIRGIKESRIKELQAIYTQFLEDVKEMNIAHGSMCTNTAVKFNIGKQKYYRSKLILASKKNKNKDGIGAVNYIEHIVPQIDLTLHYCTATQDMFDTKSVTFKRLNTITNRINKIDDQDIINLTHVVNNSCITYSCTFCYKTFSDNQAVKDITAHFAQEHKVGHLVVCFKCSKQFQIHVLTGNRWKHTCV